MRNKRTNSVDVQVGTRVRIRRMMIGMSQSRLAEALNLTFQQVQKYEKGTNRIGAGRLFQIAQILSVPIEYFFAGVNGESEEAIAEAPGAWPPFVEFVSSNEGLQLSLAFMKIKDVEVRKRLLKLMKSLSSDPGLGSTS